MFWKRSGSRKRNKQSKNKVVVNVVKTLFIPIFYKQQARNVLETDILATLSSRAGLKIVLFVPEFKKEYFERFARENVVMEPVGDKPEILSKMDALFHSISLNYIDSNTLRIFRKKYFLRNPARLRYFLRRMATVILGRCRPLRRFFRWCDGRFIRDDFFSRAFEQYHPDLVFVPHLISKFDRAMLRESKRRSIPSVGAVHSWDNITAVKNPIQLLPDTLIAYNEIIKEESIKYLDMPSSRVVVTGLPHYDYYVKEKRSSREDFFRRIGADPNKRLILFSPAGKIESDTDWHIVAILERAIAEGKLGNAQILVREHPVSEMSRGELKSSPRVVFDVPFTTFGGGREFKEITADDMKHLADSLFFSDVTINICSTLAIDAAAFDKPVINVMFDGWATKPYIESIRRFYDHDHYRAILRSGGVRVARTPEELVEHVSRYLENPSLDHEGRARIVREQCWRMDGQAGARVSAVLLEKLKI